MWVNAHHRNDPSSPWGGLVAAPTNVPGSASSGSGMGSENGTEALDAYRQTKSVTFSLASSDERLVADDWFAERQAPGARYG